MSPESSSVETHRLLQVLSHAENGDAAWCSEPNWDWRRFADACKFHQVAPLVFFRLNSLPEHAVPAGLLEHLRAGFYQICFTNYLLANQLAALTARLATENIPVLAYKGPAVALAVYGDLTLREYHDLDLLIHLDHLPSALTVMARAGFQIERNIRPDSRRLHAEFHHIEFRAPDQSHFVELHWQLGGNLWQSFTPDVKKLWDRIETLQMPHGPISTMCREDLFLVLCFHGAKHRWWCLKWLLDVAELLRKADTWDWSRIEEMIENRRGTRAAASLGLLLAHELLGVPIPSAAAKVLPVTPRVRSVAEAIRQEILSRGHTADDPHRTLLGLEDRLTARMKYRCTRWLRLNIRVNIRDRAVIQLPERIGFLYVCIRPLRLLLKYGGQGARAAWSWARRMGNPTYRGIL